MPNCIVVSNLANAAAVSPTILASSNCVLYRGYTNPLYVSAPGNSGISVSATGGATVAKGKLDGFAGEYIVTVPASCSASTITINVNANGKNIGHQNFKVVDVPTPLITIGGYESGSTIPKSVIKSSPSIDAVFNPDAFFPFDEVNYTVTSFAYLKEVRGVVSKCIVRGNTIPGDVLSDISKKASGSPISIIDIEVSTPSGSKKFGFTATLE